MTEGLIKVSVILPIYNVEKYISQSLDCLLNQTLKEIAIICVDDGSTDNTPKILEDYRQKDSRIHVIRQKNQYAGVARNNGFEYQLRLPGGGAPYVIFLDPDDIYAKDMLEKLYNRAIETKADVVLSHLNYVIDNRVSFRPSSFYESYLIHKYIKDVFSWKELGGDVFFFHVYPFNKLCSVDFLQKNHFRFQGVRNTNDAVFGLDIISFAERIAHIADAPYFYRFNRDNNTRTTKGKNLDSVLLAYDEALRHIQKHPDYEKIKPQFLLALVQFYAFHIYTYCVKEDKKKECFSLISKQKDFFHKAQAFIRKTYLETPDVLIMQRYAFPKQLPRTEDLGLHIERFLKQKKFSIYKKIKHFIWHQKAKNDIIKMYLLGFLIFKKEKKQNKTICKVLGISLYKEKKKNNIIIGKLCGIKIFKSKALPYKRILSQMIHKADIHRGEDAYILFVNSGETYLVAQVLKDFYQKERPNRPKIIVPRLYQKIIISMYAPWADVVVFPEKNENYRHVCRYIEKKSYIKGVHFKNIIPIDMWYGEEVKKVHYFSLIMKMMGLPIEKTYLFQKPQFISFGKKWGVQQRFLQMNLNRDRFIFLSPEATTISPIPNHLWQDFIDKVREKGYDVFLNTTCSPQLEGCKSCFLDFEEAYELASYAKAIIGLRSGFLETLTTINTPFHVIYNRDIQGNNNRLLRNTLLKLPGVHPEQIHEYDYLKNPRCLEDILKLL